MVRKFSQFRGWGTLALVICGVVFLFSTVLALNVVITCTQDCVEFRFFEVTTAAYHKHTGGAPATGNTYTEVGWGSGNHVSVISVNDGACQTRNVWLSERDDWYLELNADVTSGTATAFVYSSGVTSCLPDCSSDRP